MNESLRQPQSDFQALPNITFRQLEVFWIVCREGSYANAALELRSTRTNIKRVCEDFEQVVGRSLFTDGPERTLLPTLFAKGLLGQFTPLARCLRRMDESVRSIHEKGRILRPFTSYRSTYNHGNKVMSYVYVQYNNTSNTKQIITEL